MIHIDYFVFNAFQTRCSLIWDNDGTCAFIDPGCHTEQEFAKLTETVRSKGLKPACIMLTHCHFDHIYGITRLSKTYGIPVYAHKNEMFTLQVTNPSICKSFGLPEPEADPDQIQFITGADTVTVGSLTFEVLETPGHSPGGICFLERTEKILFCGDTLFAGAIGRTDHPGGDYDTIMKSIFEKLICLDGDIAVIPGHGPESDIATERMTNPFLLPFNEPYEE